MKNPIRTTVVYALASGFVVVPMALMLITYLPWPTAFKLTLWADLALYGVLMAHWSGTRLWALAFPMTILLGTALWPGTYVGFFILALGVFSWMRSGICFQTLSVRSLIAEVITIVGGAAMLLFLGSHTPAAWALNICLFFLVQSLYFFLVPLPRIHHTAKVLKDPFEQAVEDATKVLEGL